MLNELLMVTEKAITYNGMIGFVIRFCYERYEKDEEVQKEEGVQTIYCCDGSDSNQLPNLK